MEQTTLPKLDFLDALTDEGGRPVERNIRIAAALLGPGYAGRRADLSKQERKEAALQVSEVWDSAGLGERPAYLDEALAGTERRWRDRKAKLFEAGAYEDKEITAGQADLHRLADEFSFPAPILIEHVENPLRLGYLTHVQAAGPELFGTLTLSEEADELLESSGAKSLSISVSRDLDRIYEVSIVGNPRVESARLFCKDFRERQEDGAWKSEALRLREERELEKTEQAVQGLIRSGSIPPACAEAAVGLFRAARRHGLERKLIEFCEALPKSAQFGEIAPSGKVASGIDPIESEFYSRVFPHLDIEEIMKRKVK